MCFCLHHALLVKGLLCMGKLTSHRLPGIKIAKGAVVEQQCMYSNALSVFREGKKKKKKAQYLQVTKMIKKRVVVHPECKHVCYQVLKTTHI